MTRDKFNYCSDTKTSSSFWIVCFFFGTILTPSSSGNIQMHPRSITNEVRVNEAGWSGSILASRLTKDQRITDFLFQALKSEVTRTVSVRVVNMACLIECRIWHPREFVFLYEFLNNIAMNIQEMLSELHFGEKMKR